MRPYITISGKRQYLWRAVDQDGDVIDILVQPRRNGRAAKRFFRKLLKSQRHAPHRIVTDKLGSYRVAHREVMPLVTHETTRYANNRAEVSHQPRQRERQMRCFKSPDQAQHFLHVHGVVQNLFRLAIDSVGSLSDAAGALLQRVGRRDGRLTSLRHASFWPTPVKLTVPPSARILSPPRSARAAWARCIERETPEFY